MELEEFKKQFIRDELRINEDYGRIFSFIDFSNVNKWFADDRQDSENHSLSEDKLLTIDIEKMNDFLNIFSNDTRFYYGHNPQKVGSMSFLRKSKYVFSKNRVFTKPIQWVRHYLSDEETESNTRNIFNDDDGSYIHIPKCNFDVEMSVDALKLIDKYDTFCLLSGDADFVYLNTYLHTKGKKIILVKGGHITRALRKTADIIINAQDIKKHLTQIKQKPSG